VICSFLLGSASAIRKVATDRAALWTGILLVLLAGIARNYDQSYFLNTPMWLIGPLAFSFFSGSFLYGILIRGIAKRHFPENRRDEKSWTTFMALFWMTAPIAIRILQIFFRPFSISCAAQVSPTFNTPS